MRAPTVLVTGVGGPAGRSLSVQLLERGFRVVDGVVSRPEAALGGDIGRAS